LVGAGRGLLYSSVNKASKLPQTGGGIRRNIHGGAFRVHPPGSAGDARPADPGRAAVRPQTAGGRGLPRQGDRGGQEGDQRAGGRAGRGDGGVKEGDQRPGGRGGPPPGGAAPGAGGAGAAAPAAAGRDDGAEV